MFLVLSPAVLLVPLLAEIVQKSKPLFSVKIGHINSKMLISLKLVI
nr:MAG TPA: hypothetical protein [Microviridae sp.]